MEPEFSTKENVVYSTLFFVIIAAIVYVWGVSMSFFVEWSSDNNMATETECRLSSYTMISVQEYHYKPWLFPKCYYKANGQWMDAEELSTLRDYRADYKIRLERGEFITNYK